MIKDDKKEVAFPVLITVAELTSHIHNHRGRSDSPFAADSPAWLAHFLGVKSAERKWKLSAEYFDREMEKGCLLMVDGLDEAPNATERESMSALLDGAIHAYPKTSFVVTTRPMSYTGKAVLSRFERRQVAELDSESIDTFLKHWSRLLHPGSEEASNTHFRELRAALRNPEIQRMASNPVMLTALAVVHWNERRLPEQRADLYKSILDWLSRQREKRPGRVLATECLKRLAQLALAMQCHPQGRRVQMPKREAALALAPLSLEEAERFLEEEEVDSGIVVSRGREIRFWHLIFQEFLAARVLSGNAPRRARMIEQGAAFLPEQRETVLLAAGILSDDGLGTPNVDELAGALLDRTGPELADRARCVGLLGAIERDLHPYKYKINDARYAMVVDEVYGIFDAKKSAGIDFNVRLDAAEALGQAGDRRLRENNWITIEAGTFRVGADKTTDKDADDDESPIHEVYLDAYQIGRYPVTVAEYLAFVESEQFRNSELDEPEDWEEQKRHLNRPVVSVSWNEASAYCKWVGRLLPTEAQWECAARGVEGRKYPWQGLQEPDATRANYADEGPGHPTPMGLYPLGSTPEGICDLAGNVWEWVRDWYGPYDQASQKNPLGPPKGDRRVLRGGSWVATATYLRAADRFRGQPGARIDVIGFRCVREV